MPKTTVFTCDQCGKREESEKSDNQNYGYIAISVYCNSYISTSLQSKRIILCNECIEKLGIIKEAENKQYSLNTAEQLYDVIAHIVQETTPV